MHQTLQVAYVYAVVTPRALLVVAGLLQYLLLPSPISQIARKSFIDENAFQPGQVACSVWYGAALLRSTQVNTYFGWNEVAMADEIAARVETLSLSGSEQEWGHWLLL